ncbi:DUF6089 family protein [Flavobacterium sp.]|uniref:type IX secretion system protein PorG n=1 Tax=Flavobacterium sp. TaxID=239 RepID=UPI0039E716B4
MHRFFGFILFLLFGTPLATAQIHEIGLFLGASNFIGDVGSTTYIAPNEPAVGILYKWNKSPRHSWRVSFTHAELSAKDADSDMPSRKQRDLAFKSYVNEFSVGLEFDFFEFDLHDSKPQFTPYVYSGVSYALYKGLFYVAGEQRSDSEHGTLAIPMTVGIKTRILPHLVLGVESGARFTFADDIDGSNPTNDNLASQRFGNTNSKDWYVFTGFTLTYTFGNKPCFCAE